MVYGTRTIQLPVEKGYTVRAFWVRLCAIVVVVGIVAAGCGTATTPVSEKTTDAATGEASAPTVEEIYRDLGQTLKQPGYIFHSTITVEMSAGPYSRTGTLERWVDAERDVAREEVTFTPTNGTEQKSASVIANGGNYRLEPYGDVSVTEPRSCHGATAAISLVLGCPGATEQSTTTIETGTYNGKPAIVLVTSGTSSGSDERHTFTNRLYLYPNDFLPIVLESDGTIDYGETTPARGKWVFTNEFIPADSLPGNFFDPASIGYVERDPAEPLRQTDWGIPVYWLGRHAEGTGDLPGLTLGHVEVPRYPGPGYKFILQYRGVDAPGGPPLLSVEEWSTADWDAIDTTNRTKRPPRWENPCWEREELELPDGRATIFSGFSLETLHGTSPDGSSSEARCPDQPHDMFIAHVELGPTFLVIQATSGRVLGKTGIVRSPYDSRDGMEAALRALQMFKGGS